MESYVEVSFLIQVLTMLISCMTAGYLSLHPLSFKQMFIYSILISFMACAFWMEFSWIIILIIEILFFLLYFRMSWKAFLLTIAMRFLLSFTWYVVYRGGFHNFQYFYPMRSPIQILILLFVILWLLCRKWNYWIGKLSYIYECKIEEIDQKHWWRGYLDSGNLLMMEDVPVIFIDQKYVTYLKSCRIQYLVMKTMSQSVTIPCYEGHIEIRGLMKKKVYIRCEKDMQLPMQAQILLNVNLWLG